METRARARVSIPNSLGDMPNLEKSILLSNDSIRTRRSVLRRESIGSLGTGEITMSNGHRDRLNSISPGTPKLYTRAMNANAANNNQKERMIMIKNALNGWNDHPKKLFELSTWKPLITNAVAGTSNARKYKHDTRLTSICRVIIEQIASPGFSSEIAEILSTSRTRQGSRNGGNDFMATEFLIQCELYTEKTSEIRWKKAIGEYTDEDDDNENGSPNRFVVEEGEKYDGPLLNTDELLKLSDDVEGEPELAETEPEPEVFDPPPEQDKENLPKSEQEIARDFPKPLSCPDLKPQMFREIDDALAKPKKEKLVTAFSITIRQEQLAVYNKPEWLEDANIDYYLELIKERNNKHEMLPKVYIFHSYFYKILEKRGYEAVQGATSNENIFDFDLVLIPIHYNHHWVLVVVDFKELAITCYDSMDHDNSKHLNIICGYIYEEWRRINVSTHQNHAKDSGFGNNGKKPPLFNDGSAIDEILEIYESSNWKISDLGASDLPQQKNGRDCGVFCLQYAEYLSRCQPFDFEQRHTAYFRKRMMYETLKKTLLIS